MPGSGAGLPGRMRFPDPYTYTHPDERPDSRPDGDPCDTPSAYWEARDLCEGWRMEDTLTYRFQL